MTSGGWDGGRQEFFDDFTFDGKRWIGKDVVGKFGERKGEKVLVVDSQIVGWQVEV